MTSIAPYLKKMDQEIMRLRQEIAIRQLEIHKIEESRLTIMGIEQRSNGEADPMSNGLLNGTSYDQRPALIVRNGTGGEDGSASRAAKEGVNASGNRRGMNQSTKPKKRMPGSEQAHFRDRIRALLTDATEPMDSKAMADQFGLPNNAVARKPLQNALFTMHREGQLQRDADRRYFLARLNPPPAAGSPQ